MGERIELPGGYGFYLITEAPEFKDYAPPFRGSYVLVDPSGKHIRQMADYQALPFAAAMNAQTPARVAGDAALRAALTAPTQGDAAGWQPLSAAPKDGSPFLVKVKDWYRNKEVCYHILSMNNGYYETAYTGDQTFDADDIIAVKLLVAPQQGDEPDNLAERIDEARRKFKYEREVAIPQRVKAQMDELMKKYPQGAEHEK